MVILQGWFRSSFLVILTILLCLYMKSLTLLLHFCIFLFNICHIIGLNLKLINNNLSMKGQQQWQCLIDIWNFTSNILDTIDLWFTYLPPCVTFFFRYFFLSFFLSFFFFCLSPSLECFVLQSNKIWSLNEIDLLDLVLLE